MKKQKILPLILSLGLVASMFTGAFAQNDSTVTVTIAKYIDGVHATAANANNASFPMHAIFPGGEGDFDLGPAGFNNPTAYEATTAEMPQGSNYQTSETLTGATAGQNCDGNHPFAFVGYSIGDSISGAASATTTAIAPNLTNIDSDKFIIVWNKTCPETPVTGSLTVTKKTIGGEGIFNFTGTGNIDPFQITTASSTGSKTIEGLTPGSYTINEGALPAGWSMASSTCSSVSVVASQSANCEINNTFAATSTTGSLTVVKKTIGGNGTFKFASDNAGVGNFSITTANGTGNKTFSNLTPGTYDVDEITHLPLGGGWTETKTTCNGVTVASGQTATCEIENTFATSTAPTVTVTIVKYLDGAEATAASAQNASFPMTSTWNATNIGAGSGAYSLSPEGFNNSSPYRATTSGMSSGASYSTSENLPSNCSESNKYMLAGYSIGDSITSAAAASTTNAAPELNNITGNKFIIVWNKTCAETPSTGSLTVTKKTIGGNGTFNFDFDDRDTESFSITTTNGTGSKTISGITPGNYALNEITPLPQGWSTTGNTCGSISIVAGQTASCEIENTFTPNGGGGGGQQTVKVHVVKYLDGALATAAAANSYLFPMKASWSASNIGTSTGNYVLGNNHGGASDLYGADTSAMSKPASYSTNEITRDIDPASDVLPINATCASGKYKLVGYTADNSLAQAQSATPTASAPAFTGLTSDKYIIVWNKSCDANSQPNGLNSISGMVYNDRNHDRFKEIGEFGLSGWTIYLDTNNNGIMDSGEKSTSTDRLGNYRFTNLADGTYHVREVLKSGWTQSYPSRGANNVIVGWSSRFAAWKNFGVYPSATGSIMNGGMAQALKYFGQNTQI